MKPGAAKRSAGAAPPFAPVAGAAADSRSSPAALAAIPVGVIVERRRATSPWLDFVWRPVSVLDGAPTAAPWTALGAEGDVHTLYAGPATIELYRTETANYRANLTSGTPALWVVLRPSGAEPPYQVFAVTADPAEAEAFTEAGNDLVEPVPMPRSVARTLEAFVAEHHVERLPPQRQRSRAAPDEPRPRRRGEENGE
jgi:uncharacterized protein DUF3305